MALPKSAVASLGSPRTPLEVIRFSPRRKRSSRSNSPRYPGSARSIRAVSGRSASTIDVSMRSACTAGIRWSSPRANGALVRASTKVAKSRTGVSRTPRLEQCSRRSGSESRRGPKLPPWDDVNITCDSPLAARHRRCSLTTATNSAGGILKVPGKPIWCSEQPGRIIGATRASPSRRATRSAISSPYQQSVSHARWGPCCSIDAATRIAVRWPLSTIAWMSGQASCSILSSWTVFCICSKTNGRMRSLQEMQGSGGMDDQPSLRAA